MNIDHPVVHVLDASRSVVVVSSLLEPNEEKREDYVEDVIDLYEEMREDYAGLEDRRLLLWECFNEHDYPTTIRKQTQQEKNEDFIQLCLTRSTIPPAMHQKDAALISLLQQDKRKIEALDTNIKFNRYWKSMSHKKPKRLIRLL